VVVHFNPYAGGKFWINCLSHHAQAIPGLCIGVPKHDVDLWLLAGLAPWETQQRKIHRINSSLPPINDIANWCHYELGCNQFWGDDLDNLFNHPDIPHTSIQLLDRYRCFIVNHRPQESHVRELCRRLPRAQHVLLTNADNFQRVSMDKKQPNPWPLKYDTISNFNGFQVDVDNTYMNVELTIDRVKDCLEYLGLSTDLDLNIHDFVKRYFDLHR
jgi:hypothetical protein